MFSPTLPWWLFLTSVPTPTRPSTLCSYANEPTVVSYDFIVPNTFLQQPTSYSFQILFLWNFTQLSGQNKSCSFSALLLQQVDKPPTEIKNELNRPQCTWKHLPHFHLATGILCPAVQGRRLILPDQCLNCIWSSSSGQLAHMYSIPWSEKWQKEQLCARRMRSNPRILTSWDNYVRHTVAWAHLLMQAPKRGLWDLISYTLH